MKTYTYQTKNCRFKAIIQAVAIGAAGVLLAAFLITILFEAAVNYTFRYNPPTAEELAENPQLIKYVPSGN